MDFFDRQDKARRQTKVLVLYFATGVILLVVAIYLAITLVMQWQGGQQQFMEPRSTSWWKPELFAGTAIVTTTIILFGSLFKTLQLSRGGSAVASMLGGREVNRNTDDPDERKLLNVVEEMSLASGVPVPKVYVMDEELGINAFAAGHTMSDAVVGVTRGCMKILSRDELQGVIAHEFSHILNGDMRLNLRLMGWIFGIFCIAVVGRILLHTRGGSRRDNNLLPLLGLIFLALGSIGVVFGRLIQAAVSRQREYLADAAAVQFTRNPTGLAGALKKIGGLAFGSKLESPHATEASHMFFGNGVGALSGLMATHPPLEERIRAIDPAFDGNFPEVKVPSSREVEEIEYPHRERRGPFPFPFEIPGASRLDAAVASAQPRPARPPAIPASALLPTLGAPGSRQLRYAVELRDSFPPVVQQAARDALGAESLVYALIISGEPGLRGRQLEIVGSAASLAVRRETERLLPAVGQVAIRARLPLVDLALPALKQLSASQFQQFERTLQLLVSSDNEINLFEYVVQKIVMRHLEPEFRPTRRGVIQFYSFRPIAPDAAVLLSGLAHTGSDDPQAAVQVFRRGATRLEQASQIGLEFLPAEAACDLTRIDAALDRLNQAAPQIKKNVLIACADTIAADGWIQETEAELLRAIADTLDCPIPPIIANLDT